MGGSLHALFRCVAITSLVSALVYAPGKWLESRVLERRPIPDKA